MRKTGVVAFAFGVPHSILSNQRISLLATHHAIHLKARIYTQRDIYIEAGCQFGENGIKVDYTDEDPANPPPTLRMARGAVQWAKEQGIELLLVVAAKPHLWRCMRDLSKAAEEFGGTIEIRVCEEIEEWPEDSWFCPDSTQERVRSRTSWNKRETILKLMPFWIYKRVAN